MIGVFVCVFVAVLGRVAVGVPFVAVLVIMMIVFARIPVCVIVLVFRHLSYFLFRVLTDACCLLPTAFFTSPSPFLP